MAFLIVGLLMLMSPTSGFADVVENLEPGGKYVFQTSEGKVTVTCSGNAISPGVLNRGCKCEDHYITGGFVYRLVLDVLYSNGAHFNTVLDDGIRSLAACHQKRDGQFHEECHAK